MRLYNLMLIPMLLACLCVPARGSVTLRGQLQQSEGVRWAAEELNKTGKSPKITAEIAPKDLGVGDGYVLEPGKSGLLLRGNSPGAVIYGLLDIRDRIKQGLSPSPALRTYRTAAKPSPASGEGVGGASPAKRRGGRWSFTPALRFRAMADNFPFWVGSTMYSNAWKGFEGVETDPDSWWRDRQGWTKRFRECAERRVNALVWDHPHPYPALLVYDKYPEAQVYSPEQARKNAEDLAWIVQEGKKYGVSIYFLTWNICVPPSFAKAHGVEEFGSQAPIVKDYTRYCVRKLFDTYPDLGGLITMGAETPVGCTDWVIENIVSAMNASKAKPNLIWWGWCTYPEDSLKVKRAYKGRTEVLHYLEYEQFFKPMADPRIGRWSRETGGTKMIALGGPKSALGYFTWGDPVWAHDIIRSLAEDNNGSGMILETWTAAPWLARESFCRYMWSLNREDAKQRKHEAIEDEWRSRLAERYDPSVAADYLSCYQAASKIIPRFVCLVHSQTDHYQPQLGLPLVYYLAMPTLSSYVFEWYDGVDNRGRLTPNYGLTWPNPDWGEKVISVNDYAVALAKGKTSFTSTTPLGIADEIEAGGLQALDLLEKLDALKPARNAAEYQQSLKLLRMNALWGLQAAWKIRAAVNWALFKQGATPDAAEQCVKCLERSLEWYGKLAEAASQVYPGPISTYVSYLSTPPPWKQNDIWFSYRLANLHWRDMVPRYERELELVKEQLKLGPKLAQPPLPDRFWQEKEARVVASFDFERDDPRLILDPATDLTSQNTISGARSLVYDSRGVEGEWHTFLRTDPTKLPLEIGKRYQVRYRYRILANSQQFTQPFAAAARSEKGGFTRDIGNFRTWSAPAGSSGEHVFQFEPREFDDYHLFILIRGSAAMMIDDLTIAEIGGGG